MKKYTTAKWLKDTLGLKASHALYREDGIWYHHLERFPGILFDANGYLIINSEDEYKSHPEFRLTKALTVKGGISHFKGYIEFTKDQKRLILIEEVVDDKIAEEQATRRLREVEVIVRNRKHVDAIKQLYEDVCQLCDNSLKIRDNIFYSEVHHIKPLGEPHNGPDNKENMMCVCPNCHVQLDLGAIKLKLTNIINSKHKISDKYISYHNATIFYYNLKR
jgi:5-methylcytosine-specific restriction protein A